MLEKIEDIQNIIYINLEHRLDRKTHIELQLEILNFKSKSQRFNAIRDKFHPAKGCTQSHIGCLQIALDNGWDHVLILEDDALFTNPKLFLTQLNKFLLRHKSWDVLIIAGNNLDEYEIIDETCIKIERCYAATGYLVAGHYIKTLLDNFSESLNKGCPVDVGWCSLQKTNKWLMLTPLTIIQKPDYSDIEKTYVDYSYRMLKMTRD